MDAFNDLNDATPLSTVQAGKSHVSMHHVHQIVLPLHTHCVSTWSKITRSFKGTPDNYLVTADDFSDVKNISSAARAKYSGRHLYKGPV